MKNKDKLGYDVSVPLPYQAQVADLQLYSSVQRHMNCILGGKPEYPSYRTDVQGCTSAHGS